MLNITQHPAAPGNYTTGRGGSPVQLVVVHTMQGSLAGSTAWFADPRAKCSSHYGIGFDGTVHQYVQEADTAYHAGNFNYNRRSIGIELEGFAERGVFPDSMLKALYTLVRNCCDKYNIPYDRTHIIGHNEVPSPDGNGLGGLGHHTDPGTKFPWADLMSIGTNAGV
jgi:N-acetyl-anhydromuramyl-L-alanine amidase AmpD